MYSAGESHYPKDWHDIVERMVMLGGTIRRAELSKVASISKESSFEVINIEGFTVKDLRLKMLAVTAISEHRKCLKGTF